MNKHPSVGVVILTLNAKHHLKSCLPHYLASPLNPRVLVVDSSSQDGTVEIAKSFGAETITIERHTFNHGLTREMARRHLGTDIVVMATPDAYPVDNTLIEKLIQPIVDGKAAVAYARQLPHIGSGFFESFARDFNYPGHSQIRGIEDVMRYGTYTFFCSNSCAAYSNSALDMIGGFKPVLLGEDTVAVAELLRQGQKVAYVAEAQVYHSHNYSLWQEFKRYFDTGAAREQYRHLIATTSDDVDRGKQFVKAMMRRILQEKPTLLPYAVAHTLSKWIGFQLGKQNRLLPLCLVRIFTGHRAYWGA